jgi:hypothetical protein
MQLSDRFWKGFWIVAALFNFSMGVPIALAPDWAFAMTFTAGAGHDPVAVALWRDFGVMVVVIGIGYAIVAARPSNNRGIVWLGILAKLFDVTTLTLRWAIGIANPIVLIPAAIDGAFGFLFALFLWRTGKTSDARS